MKKIFTVMLLVYSVSICKAQFVTIPDTAFVNWLNKHYPSCMKGNKLDTTCNLILNSISATIGPDSNIVNVDGLRYFKKLQGIEIDGTSITNLPPLPKSLVALYCEVNKLTSLPSLPSTLQFLGCVNNKLIQLPKLPDSLRYLNCARNNLQSLPDFPSKLIHVECYSNPLTALPTLPSTLIYLDCYNDSLNSLPSLPDNLHILICSQNKLTSLPVLSSFMHQLDCHSNKITNLLVLPGSLDTLVGNANLLTSLPSFPKNLIYISVDDNQISSVPTFPPNMLVFSAEHNNIASIPDLPNNPIFLDLSYNNLISLPSLPDSLNALLISNNKNLKCLPQLNKIEYFFFDSTGIGCLPDYPIVTLSSPKLNTYPLCSSSNPNNCPLISTNLNDVNVFCNLLLVYPNPATDIINIEVLNGIAPNNITIRDVTGRAWKQFRPHQPNSQLSIKELPQGVYFVEVQTAAGKAISKIVRGE